MNSEQLPETAAPEWWKRAREDLRAAEALLEDDRGAPWVVAYHAQQAVEKGIKAYLVARGMSAAASAFRTHEIDDLRLLVGDHDKSLAHRLALADPLADYAVESRYPPAAPGVEDVSLDEAREGLELAEKAMDIIAKELADHLPGSPPVDIRSSRESNGPAGH